MAYFGAAPRSPKKMVKYDFYFKVFAFVAFLVFGGSLYYLWNDFTYLGNEISSNILTSSKSGLVNNNSDMKTIELRNEFTKEIAIYYDDGDIGLYLSTLLPEETITISATIGQGLYATEVNGFERLDFIAIRSSQRNYVFAPHINNALQQRQLNVEKRSRVHPSVIFLHTIAAAMSTRFKSLIGHDVQLWFNTGAPQGTLIGHLHPGQETTTSSYVGHRFYVTNMHSQERIQDIVITNDQVAYYLEDPTNPAKESILEAAQREKAFMAEYYNRTGIQWRHFFDGEKPRPPPVLYMYPAKEIGDVHRVVTAENYWHCSGIKTSCQYPTTIATAATTTTSSGGLVKAKKSVPPLVLELEVVSTRPKAFIIEHFLSEFEADEIVKISSKKLHHSSVGDMEAGAFESETRTSFNTWLNRGTSPMIDSLYRRAADLLQIDEALLTRSKNVEDIQVVHYDIGQKYEAHHDWGVSGHPDSRYITLLLYLNNVTKGGETSFPKGNNGLGFKVKPRKGMAVLFYNLLEDGNADDLSLHAALPVAEGEKWLANFWVWDPKIF